MAATTDDLSCHLAPGMVTASKGPLPLCAALLTGNDHVRDQHGRGAEGAVEAKVIRAPGDVPEHIQNVSGDGNAPHRIVTLTPDV